jgi:hypothetical protein
LGFLTGRLSGFWESLNYQSTSARPSSHISGKSGNRWIWEVVLVFIDGNDMFVQPKRFHFFLARDLKTF